MSEIPVMPSPGPLSTETQLALMNQKLDMIIVQTTDRGRDHENRLRKLEQFKWVIVGLAGASGGLGGYAASLLR